VRESVLNKDKVIDKETCVKYLNNGPALPLWLEQAVHRLNVTG